MQIQKRVIALGMAAVLAVAACGGATQTTAPSGGISTIAPATDAPSGEPTTAPSEAPASAAPLAPDPAEAVIPNVESGATIKLWTFWLSPTFDQYIADTITRFEATYPGVTVEWEDHQATFQDDLKNSFNAGNAPDVINLSVGEGWVSDYASRGLLLGLNDKVPQAVQDIYFDGLWNSQLVDGQNFQFPWYQGISVELINKRIFEEGAGLKVEDFPTTVDGLPALCQTIKDATGTLCDIRLTVNDLLSQMVYEGDVDVINDDGSAFTFDSAAGVAWLQMYVDMVKAGTVDNTALTTADDRIGLLLFSSGQAPFYQTGPNLIREVKSNNETLYNDLAVVPAPVGKSGVVGKGLMGMSVKADTQYPNASIALAQFFTNPRAMVEFAKQVAVYPSSAAAYDDPFFASTPEAVEDSARPIAKDIVSKYADIVPTIPNKPDVNEIVRKAVEAALFADKPAQQALSDAVAEANALLD
jgi:putative chitobiose transport system substrate-binding protein